MSFELSEDFTLDKLSRIIESEGSPFFNFIYNFIEIKDEETKQKFILKIASLSPYNSYYYNFIDKLKLSEEEILLALDKDCEYCYIKYSKTFYESCSIKCLQKDLRLYDSLKENGKTNEAVDNFYNLNNL